MGKLIITNVNDFDNKLSDIFQSFGLINNGTIHEDDFYLRTFSKLNVKTYNLYVNGLDFVACAGTLIFKGKSGHDALADIYSCCQKEFDIKKIRYDCQGMYVLAIKISKCIRVFVDESNAYTFYYWFADNRWIMTNTYYHIEKCVHESVDMNALLELLQQEVILDNRTAFKNIFRLRKNEIIELNNDKGTFEICNVEINNYKINASSFEDTVDEIASLMLSATANEKAIPYRTFRFCTGGVDSRLYLASELAVGQKPYLGVWFGDCAEMGTNCNQDKLVVEKLAARFGFDYFAFDISRDFHDSFNQDLHCHFEKYGEYGVFYAANLSWYSIFEENKDIVKFVKCGFFSDLIRSLGFLDQSYKEPFSIDDYSRMYCRRFFPNDGTNTVKDWSFHENYVKEKINSICSGLKLNSNSLTKEDCMILYSIYRQMDNSGLNNLANLFAFSYNSLGENRIAQRLNQVVYSYKEHEHLVLALTNKLYPELTKVEFFSHTNKSYFDKRKMELYKGNIISSKFRNVIKIFFKSFKAGSKIIDGYISEANRKAVNSNYELRKAYIDCIDSLDVIKRLNVNLTTESYTYFAIYYYYYLYGYMIDSLIDEPI